MTHDSRLIAGFYVVALLVVIVAGLQVGFTHSHTMPLPVLLNGLFVFCGLIWATTDLFVWLLNRKGNRAMMWAHIGGLLANILVFYQLIF